MLLLNNSNNNNKNITCNQLQTDNKQQLNKQHINHKNKTTKGIFTLSQEQTIQ